MTEASPSRIGGGGLWSSTRARYLMPVAFVTYSLAYLDRSNYAIASAGGMAEDLNLSAGTDSLIAASFFLGYFFFQIPGTIYAEQRSIRRGRLRLHGGVHADLLGTDARREGTAGDGRSAGYGEPAAGPRP
ncbi:MAG: hypothetical protein ACRDP3_00505 [Streptomyces sp.]|uniref:hypothetical protein n=1 Tax=Streptomyces sp. TaxID=1931 RepID=UPI003D6BBA7A